MTQKITPFLWFNGNAEGAMNFYLHPGHIVLRELRDATGGGRAVGEALRGWTQELDGDGYPSP